MFKSTITMEYLTPVVVMHKITGELMLRVKRDLHKVHLQDRVDMFFVVENNECKGLVEVDKYHNEYEVLGVLWK